MPALRRASPVSGTLAVAKHLDPRRFQVSIGVLDAIEREGAVLREQLRGNGIDVLELNPRGRTSYPALPSVRRTIAALRFDIVHSYGFRPDLVNGFGRRSHLAYAFVRENSLHNYSREFGAVAGAFFAAVHTAALRRMDGVTPIAAPLKAELVRRGVREERVTCVPNALDDSWWTRTAPARGARDTIEIGCIARLIPLKRVEWAIRGVAELQRRHPSASLRLHIAGEGPARDDLEREARAVAPGSVIFHGQVEDVLELLSGLDVVVLTSESEGVPRSVMEAMTLGITCIAPRVGGVGELIEDGTTGFLFDSWSFDGFMSLMERVVIGRERLDEAAVAAAARRLCDPRSAAVVLAAIYTDALQRDEHRR